MEALVSLVWEIHTGVAGVATALLVIAVIAKSMKIVSGFARFGDLLGLFVLAVVSAATRPFFQWVVGQ